MNSRFGNSPAWFPRRNVNLIVIALLVLTFTARLMFPSLNSLCLYGVTPLLFVWSIFTNPATLKNKYNIIYTILLLWIFVTVGFATNLQIAVSTFKTIIGGYVMSILFYSLVIRRDSEYDWWLLFCYILLLIVSIYYLNTSGDFDIDVSSERLDNETVNANDLAYYLFYATIANSLMNWGARKTKKILTVAVDVFLVLVVLWLSIMTASRQLLVVVLPFILFSLVFKLMDGANIYQKVMWIGIITMAAILMMAQFTSTIEGSYLQQRMEIDVQEDSRMLLLEDAINVGLEHPVLGVGPGNFVLYSNDGGFSHCSYTELFACSGFFAMVLFVLMTLRFICEQYTRYKKTHDKLFLYLFVVALAWAVYNVLYVFYLAPMLIAFLFLLVGYSDKFYYRRL